MSKQKVISDIEKKVDNMKEGPMKDGLKKDLEQKKQKNVLK